MPGTYDVGVGFGHIYVKADPADVSGGQIVDRRDRRRGEGEGVY